VLLLKGRIKDVLIFGFGRGCGSGYGYGDGDGYGNQINNGLEVLKNDIT
jgi:hypothetical protein